MGTPVVTLTGVGYVSRMSTAVLLGAGMPNGVHPLSMSIFRLHLIKLTTCRR